MDRKDLLNFGIKSTDTIRPENLDFITEPLDEKDDKVDVCSVGGLSTNPLKKKPEINREYSNPFEKGFDVIRPLELDSLDEQSLEKV